MSVVTCGAERSRKCSRVGWKWSRKRSGVGWKLTWVEQSSEWVSKINEMEWQWGDISAPQDLLNCKTTHCTQLKSHTCTVMRECFKGDEASQWKRPKFDPSPHQNPLTDLHKNWHAWLRPGRHSTCKILYQSVQGFLFPGYVILPCLWGD